MRRIGYNDNNKGQRGRSVTSAVLTMAGYELPAVLLLVAGLLYLNTDFWTLFGIEPHSFDPDHTMTLMIAGIVLFTTYVAALVVTILLPAIKEGRHAQR